MTGKLNNPVFGQPTHRIISVLLHDIKTEGLVPGEGKLGIKKKEQSLKKNGVTGGMVSLFFTPVSFFCCALCPSSPNSCISTSDRQQAAMPVQVQGGNGVKQHRGCYQKKPATWPPLRVSFLWVLCVFWDALAGLLLCVQVLSRRF